MPGEELRNESCIPSTLLSLVQRHTTEQVGLFVVGGIFWWWASEVSVHENEKGWVKGMTEEIGFSLLPCCSLTYEMGGGIGT